jgi:ligand-binding sensor domain-containing protein
MRKLYFLIFIILLPVFKSFSEPACHFRHYSTEDGLPQFTIMDMLQDKNGFMWFGTWDGLSKFDGYRFWNYKVRPRDTFYLNSNRTEKLFEDKYGRIWFQTYDKEIHCFDQSTKKFWGVQLATNLQKNPFKATRIEIKHKATKGWIVIDQIRTIDRARIVKSFESLTEKEIGAVKSILKETFVD